MLARLLERDALLSKKLRVAEQPGMVRTLARIFAHSGDSWYWLVGLALVWGIGSPLWKSRTLLMGISIIVTAVFVLVIKFSVRRRRPAGEWGEIYRKTDPHSFPSGHAARAFLLAVVSLGTGPVWLAVILVIWAPLVALARVAMGVHYVSDILAGILLGILLGVVMLLAASPLQLI